MLRTRTPSTTDNCCLPTSLQQHLQQVHSRSNHFDIIADSIWQHLTAIDSKMSNMFFFWPRSQHRGRRLLQADIQQWSGRAAARVEPSLSPQRHIKMSHRQRRTSSRNGEIICDHLWLYHFQDKQAKSSKPRRSGPKCQVLRLTRHRRDPSPIFRCVQQDWAQPRGSAAGVTFWTD